MRRFVFQLFAATLAGALGMSCFAQALNDTPEARKNRNELCAKVLCRPPTTVRLVLEDGGIIEVPFQDRSPIVLPNGWVSVLSGEEVHIAVQFDRNAVGTPRAVRRPDATSGTLTFRLRQDPKTGHSELVVTSSLKQSVKYDLGMMLPDGDRILKTSSCPVRPGLQGIEHWPHPVFQLVVARFRSIPDGTEVPCEK